VRRANIDLVSLDEMHRRLVKGDFHRRFVALTFDDGYRDNKTWAYPILKSQGIPFAIYVATSFPNRFGELYWIALESVVAANDEIVLQMHGRPCRMHCRTLNEKYQTYRAVSRWLRSRPSDAEARAIVRDLASRYGVDRVPLTSLSRRRPGQPRKARSRQVARRAHAATAARTENTK
jgi:hypothetical protein